MAATIAAAPVTVNIGSLDVNTWAFGDRPSADVDATLMLDDWLDGYGPTQEQVLATLKTGGGMGDMGGMSGMGDSTPSATGRSRQPDPRNG